MKSILPDKKRLLNKMPHIGYNDEVTGFNQAIFECEAALKKAVDEAGDEKVLKAVLAVALENDVAWRHIDFSDDFPYERVITNVKNNLSKALSQHIRGCFYKE